MHDLNEGVCRYVIGFILNMFIYKEKRFSLSFINSRIFGFNYVNDSNSVPTLSEQQIKSDHLILSSSEMCFIMGNLGLLIGDRIPKDNQVWQLYLLLREIMCIVYGEFFDDNILQHLDKLINKHHTMYKKLTNKNLTIKFHNFLHMS